MKLSDRKIGVLGGMGPAAGNYFVDLLTKLVRAERDQDHPTIVHLSASYIPDRTAYLTGRGEDPVPLMVKGLLEVDSLEPDCICIPCNTAHAPVFFERYEHETKAPILHIVRGAIAHIHTRYPEIKTIGILATDGTLAARTYEIEGAKYGIRCIYPQSGPQKRIMKVIYDIKAHGVEAVGADRLNEVLAGMREVELFIPACTELSMFFAGITDYEGKPVVDSLEALARAALQYQPSDRDWLSPEDKPDLVDTRTIVS